MNKAFIIGYLGADPELKVLSKESVCTFPIAAHERILKGDRRNETQWFRVVAWGALARICSKYLTKGSHVAIEGSFQTRAYRDGAGKKQTATEVLASDVDFLDRKKKTSDGGLPL